MKGLISSINSEKVGGSLTINKVTDSDVKAIEVRLEKEFPEYEGKVFSGIINNLVKDNAVSLSRADLIKACQKYLFEVVCYCKPLSDIKEDTSLHSLVTIMTDYLTQRYGQVVSYRLNQK